jgi:Flp pilus assembly pilin Flp
VQDFLRAEEGASSVEYGLLISFIVVASAAAILFFGNTLEQSFTNSSQQILPSWP